MGRLGGSVGWASNSWFWLRSCKVLGLSPTLGSVLTGETALRFPLSSPSAAPWLMHMFAHTHTPHLKNQNKKYYWSILESNTTGSILESNTTMSWFFISRCYYEIFTSAWSLFQLNLIGYCFGLFLSCYNMFHVFLRCLGTCGHLFMLEKLRSWTGARDIT